ncbi:MAG: hypothetical protein H6707_03560 [Deltaproteobacteria bacterium]|nr:hypothetical protein [Deltaproteobacteria bacterium]
MGYGGCVVVRRLMISAAMLCLASCCAAQGGAVAGQTGDGALVSYRRAATVSPSFWKYWGDGQAELSGYEVITERYGKLRKGRAVLIFVTETHDRRHWVKDDRGTAPLRDRVSVLKLNRTLNFQTGIYPYSVMTSVFSPVDRGVGRAAFAPTKITLSAQEWCGHVYHKLLAGRGGFHSELRSYFGDEGNSVEQVTTAEQVVYEDALLIQLRELDGAFAGGKDFRGQMIPALWRLRKLHERPRAVAVEILRSSAQYAGQAATRFEIRVAGWPTEQIYVETRYPRKILGWTDAAGARATLKKSARLAYWRLNRPGDEQALERLGL